MAIRFTPPIHLGEFLREEYLVSLGMSPGALAKRLGLPRTRIERLVSEQTAMTTDTALRLAKFFRTSPEFWMNFQQTYDLSRVGQRLEAELRSIEAIEDA